MFTGSLIFVVISSFLRTSQYLGYSLMIRIKMVNRTPRKVYGKGNKVDMASNVVSDDKLIEIISIASTIPGPAKKKSSKSHEVISVGSLTPQILRIPNWKVGKRLKLNELSGDDLTSGLDKVNVRNICPTIVEKSKFTDKVTSLNAFVVSSFEKVHKIHNSKQAEKCDDDENAKYEKEHKVNSPIIYLVDYHGDGNVGAVGDDVAQIVKAVNRDIKEK
ncbi:hypothetical protein K7X08_022139 [Anisodus acutangulus]|uniref:Uncharacterized protein n=1 Tax=Anisodus acutangulus TaxID=402998 RepID=A0A9Q1L3D4_9SOLA|nr:hypothetical protein K7X08_022139 [Anisodus acutangulus]